VFDSPRAQPELVIVGRIRRAHGVRGELLLEVMTQSPGAIFAPGARVLAGTTQGDASSGGEALTVQEVRPFKDGLLVRFGEIPDRTIAERWRDRFLLVPLSEVDAPAEDEIFVHDLVGLRVVRPDGVVIGDVIATVETAAGLLLEVQQTGGTVLMPYDLAFIREVDLDARQLVVDAPAGLFDDGAE
jgi:16S rRNA processing protein RimM